MFKAIVIECGEFYAILVDTDSVNLFKPKYIYIRCH